MGSGREKRRKHKHKRRPKTKTKQALLKVLVLRPYKWTTLKLLSDRTGVNAATVDEVMTKLAGSGDVLLQACSKWDGRWRYRPLPKCWPEEVHIREMLMAGVTEHGVLAVSVLAEEVSKRILGFKAPNAVLPIIDTMICQGELRRTHEDMQPFHKIRHPYVLKEALVRVPVDAWLKRTARAQTRAGIS